MSIAEPFAVVAIASGAVRAVHVVAVEGGAGPWSWYRDLGSLRSRIVVRVGVFVIGANGVVADVRWRETDGLHRSDETRFARYEFLGIAVVVAVALVVRVAVERACQSHTTACSSLRRHVAVESE